MKNKLSKKSIKMLQDTAGVKALYVQNLNVNLQLQLYWRSQTQKDKVHWRQLLFGQFAFLRSTLTYLLDSHAALQDLGRKPTVSTVIWISWESLENRSFQCRLQLMLCRLQVRCLTPISWNRLMWGCSPPPTAKWKSTIKLYSLTTWFALRALIGASTPAK